MKPDQATAWRIIKATTTGGQRRFHIRGREVFHGCLFCEAEFPQTDEGWQAKRDHEYAAHGQAGTFDWRELHGKRLEIAVVGTEDDAHLLETGPRSQFDIYGRDEQGQVYLLAEGCGRWTGHAGGWKWRNSPHVSALLNSGDDMPNVAE